MTAGLRVLQVVTDRDRRGAQVYALDLQAGMRELGATVETIALAAGTHGDLLPIEVLGSTRLGVRTLRALRRQARSFDAVIAHGSSTLPACAIALFGTRVPVVYRQISDPLFWARSWSRRLRVATLLRRMSGVVALSDGTSAVVRRHYWLGSNKVTVIPNAVPQQRFRPPTTAERNEARSAFGIGTEVDVALFIGALAPEKGVDLAIAAVAGVQHAVLLVAGDGPARDDLQALADAQLQGRAMFVGSLDDPRNAYWAADLLVFPTRGGDSMPAVLIEAGLCGLATVTTPVGAIAEVVENGVTGSIEPIDDGPSIAAAVARLLGDEPARRAFGRGARDRCLARFTIATTAPAWVRLLSTVSSSGARARTRRA